jgi:type 1 glutamine amidotransferase
MIGGQWVEHPGNDGAYRDCSGCRAVSELSISPSR